MPSSPNGTITGIDLPGDSTKQEFITSKNNVSSDNQVDSVKDQALTQPVTQQPSTQNQTPSNDTPQRTPPGNTNSNVGTVSSQGNTPELTAAEIAEYEKQYNNLIASAKETMEHGNFYQCRIDLSKANEINKKAELKSTYEVEKLLDQCLEKEKQQQIKRRLANYETYRGFGSGLTLVRHNNTKLYGAIDAEGNEVIKCKYETINQTSKGIPEFQLKGGLIDIYDGDGKLIRSDEKPSN